MYSHHKFITSSISEILKDAIYSTSLIGNKMELSPLFDYMMQSTFIKMCGFQEQKMKCILWELANNDFEFRYSFLNDNISSSVCSNYDDKNKIYKHLIDQINKVDNNFDITKEEFFDRKKLISNSNVSNLLGNSKLILMNPERYNIFLELWKKHFQLKDFQFACYKNNKHLLLDGREKKDGKFIGEFKLRDIYTEYLYKNRNRIAHNTKSYQHNLPTFSSLRDENYKYENYFVWFALLVLIDDIFIELYKKYLETLDQRKFL